MIVAGGAAAAWVMSMITLMFLRPKLAGHQTLTLLLAYFGLGLATVAVTAGLFTLDYRSFYARWHADIFSRDWFVQQAFTSASAIYQFLVIGSRLYLPLGPLLLVPATVILLRSTR